MGSTYYVRVVLHFCPCSSGCNIIVVSMEYSIIDVDWSQFGLFLEYESYTDSPWKEISSNHNICHIAMDTEKYVSFVIDPATSYIQDEIFLSRWDFQEDQCVINESKPTQNDVVLVASHKITNHPFLKQLLETRYGQ